MFNKTVFKNVANPEILYFIAKEVIYTNLKIYKSKNGFRIGPKKSYKISIQVINEIEQAKGSVGANISKLANKLISLIGKNYEYGYAVFIINLIIKRLAPFMDSKERLELHAPLNEHELKTIRATSSGKHIDKMVKIATSTIYFDVIKQAKKYVVKNAPNFSSLYEWELWFWNNN